MDHGIEPGGGRKEARDETWAAQTVSPVQTFRTISDRNTSLMTAFRKGMLARSSVVGWWWLGHTEFTSLYSRSWAAGSFAKWYSAHESVLDV